MLATLESGSSVSFSGKDIEIMEEIRKETVSAMKKAAVVEKGSFILFPIIWSQTGLNKKCQTINEPKQKDRKP